MKPVIDNVGKTLVPFLRSAIAVGLATLVLFPLRGLVNATTISLAFLLVVVFVARSYGSRPALMTSLVASLSFNFFFLPPYYTLSIDEPQNWLALIVFLIVGATVGHLSATARERAEMAENLYTQLQDAFEQASQTEALKRSETLKSALLDAITHDLRTPLTSIKAATTMLMEDQGREAIHRTLDPERSYDLMAVINEETDRLNTFIESMVELANIESGDVRWKRTLSSPGQLLSSALDRAAGITRDHSLSVRGGDVLPDLNVAPKAIAEAIYNLIDNAVKYSPKGGRIVLSAARAGASVRFSVEDEGPRIKTDEREHIFRKFYKSGTRSKGFGIGLAIVKGIVDAHGGSIWIEDGAKGNRFSFDLPVGENK